MFDPNIYFILISHFISKIRDNDLVGERQLASESAQIIDVDLLLLEILHSVILKKYLLELGYWILT